MRLVGKKEKPDYLLRRYFVRWGADVIEVHADPEEPSLELKKLLEEKTGIPVDEQRIFYAGMKKPFECDKNLRYYGAQGGGFFDLARDEDLADDGYTILKKNGRRNSLPTSSDHGTPKARSSSVLNDADIKKQMAKVAEEEARRAAADEKLKRLEAYRAKRAAADAQKAAEAEAKAKEEEENRKRREEEARRRAEEEAARLKAEEEAEAARQAEVAEAERLAAEVEAARIAAEAEAAQAAAEAAEAEAARQAAEEEAAKRAAEVIQVVVQTPEGKSISVQMQRSDNIKSIQEQVADQSGIAVPRQILKFNGKELTSYETADGVGLDNGSVVVLEEKPIKLTVRTPEGKSIQIEVNPFDPIQSLKEKIAAQTGMEVDQQVLKFKGNDLQDGATAKAQGLENGSVIDLQPRSIEVQVNTPDGQVIHIEMEPSDLMQSLKHTLAEETGLPVDEQLLTYAGKEVQGSDTAESLGLKTGSVLDLESKSIQVQVNTPDGQVIHIQLQPDDTMGSLKDTLEEETQLPVDQQLLTHAGKEVNDNDTAESLGLKTGSVLDLESKTIQVQVNTPDEQVIHVQLQTDDTMQSLKDTLAEETKVPVDQQLLTHAGEGLPDGETAASLGLKTGSVLDLERRNFQVQVNTPDGQVVCVELQMDDTIESLKNTLAEETGVPVDKQLLTFNGDELSNGMTAGDAGLREGSVLSLEKKPEPKPKKEKKEKKKKKSRRGSDAVHEAKDYHTEFTPTPFDLSRFKIWFMVGDMIPFEMVCPAALDIKGLKVEVLKLRNEARFVKQYFEGIEDPNVLKIYAAGSYGEGDPLPDDIPVPRDSSEYKFFSVMK